MGLDSPRRTGTPAPTGTHTGTAGRYSGSAASAPLILRGPDRSGSSAGVNGGTVVRETFPPNALIMSSRSTATPAQGLSHSAAAPIQTHPSQTTATRPNNSPRTDVNQRPQTPATYSAEFQRPSSPSWSAPAPAPVARSYTAPAPPVAALQRSAPAPTYTPSQSYSAPAASYAPRAEVTAPHPVYSAPAAPAATAPAAHSSSSSSGKNWR